MLAKVDELIDEAVKNPSEKKRPQQLFLTGDQIYADDVAPTMLAMLRDASDALLGWKEKLPGIKTNDARLEPRFGFKLTDQSLNEIRIDGYSTYFVEVLSGVEHEEVSDLSDFKSSLHDLINEADPPINQDNTDAFFNTLEKYAAPPRLRLSEEIAKFTAGDVAGNHLFTAGEYWMMYIFVWSSVLWDESAWGDNLTSENEIDKRVNKLYEKLPSVRKALANISTYMICDDHEITDDWFLNLQWCVDVFSSQLGRRILLNGMLGYALFQAWGNDPDIFNKDAPLRYPFLNAVQKWRPVQEAVQMQITADSLSGLQSDGVPDTVINTLKIIQDEGIVGENNYMYRIGEVLSQEELEKYELVILQHTEEFLHDLEIKKTLQLALGIANADMKLKVFGSRSLYVTHENPEALNWHFIVPGECHYVVVLDTRTWRSFPKETIISVADEDLVEEEIEDGKDAPELIGDDALKKQLPDKSDVNEKVLFVVSACPVIGVYWTLEVRREFKFRISGDYEDWERRENAVWNLLRRFSELEAKKVVFLSGDIHFGYTSQVEYSRPSSNNSPLLKTTFYQLTSSAQKNNDWKTRSVQAVGYSFPIPGLFDDTEHKKNDIDKAEYKLSHVLAVSPDNNSNSLEGIEPPDSNKTDESNAESIKNISCGCKRYIYKDGLFFFDGDEAVGYNNLGEVTFKNNKLIHMLYWKDNAQSQYNFHSMYEVSLTDPE